MSNTELQSITAVRSTWLKASPVQADQLPATQKVAIGSGRILYGAITAIPGVSHGRITLDTGSSWYFFGGDWRINATSTATPRPKPPSKPQATAFDPRGSEERGLIGPAMKAPMQNGDTYLLVNDSDQDAEAYDRSGTLLWKVPALARGLGRDNQWTINSSDTPPGLYKLGQLYRDYDATGGKTPVFSTSAMAYGWYSFDMIELEQQEANNGRSGIMVHGGGSACGWPAAWGPLQPLYPTRGCIRMHNQHLRDLLLPRYETGTVYVGVFQEP